MRLRVGGVGVVVYFRKEGRALGEVTKYVPTLRPPLSSTPYSPEHQVPRVQPTQARRRLRGQVLQVHGAHRGREGHALPGAHARRPALARYHQDRQNGQHERHEVRRDREERDPHLEAVRYPRCVFCLLRCLVGRMAYDSADHLIPPDSRVEIDAKIAAGYFSSGKQVTEADLFKTVGRTWEETEH